MSALTRDSMVAYLDHWRAAGVLDHVSDAATDWFALEARPAVPTAPTAGLAPRAPGPAAKILVPKPPVAADPTTRQAVASARTLDELLRCIEAFEGCGLKATAKSLCFYRGAPQARLMLIGEAPGRDEDIAGRPFVGRAGQLLDKMLAAIGLDESLVHIANTVYWRPPGNRTPTTDEMLACAPFLERQMELVGADVIMLLGGVAAKQVLGLAEGILKLRGKWRQRLVGSRQVEVLASLHPSYLLRTPAAKRQAWQDLLVLARALGR